MINTHFVSLTYMLVLFISVIDCFFLGSASDSVCNECLETEKKKFDKHFLEKTWKIKNIQKKNLNTLKALAWNALRNNENIEN